MPENWGYHIRRLREAKGLTQRELADKAGIGHAHLSRIEAGQFRAAKLPTFRRLARAFNMTADALTEQIEGGQYVEHETPLEILERLRRVTPVAIPIYPWDAFPYHAGDPVKPTTYVYRLQSKKAPVGIEGYVVHGDCLSPQVADNDVIIVDRNGTIEHGDIAICTTDHHLCIGQFRKVGDTLWLETDKQRFPLADCRVVAPVIEVIRRLK